MFNETSLIISSGRKKKSPTSIVTPSFFRKEIKNSIPVQTNNTTSTATPKAEQPKGNVTEKTSEQATNPKPVLNANIPISRRSGSALSLKSIQQKKELTAKKKVVIIDDPANMPKTQFTEEQMLALWNDYGKRMDKKGERIIGSMFAMNKPILKDNFILSLELPNETMRVDVESIQKAFLNFLHQELNNYSIDIEIEVNETVAIKHAFTPEDKYNKLKNRNPLVDLLRAKLDLDI